MRGKLLSKRNRGPIKYSLTFLPLISLMAVHKRGMLPRTTMNMERLRLIFPLVVRKSLSTCFIAASRTKSL